MNRLKTIVCGTTFGQFYIEAIKRHQDKFELVGILAGGSEGSQLCAKSNGIPLYTEVSQLPEDIDLACVVLRSGVLGGKGTDITKKLLERKINVIQEQPLHNKEIAECMKLASKYGVKFSVGNLYMNLESINAFIQASKYISKKCDILYLDMSFISQVSYPAVQIMTEFVPAMKPFRITSVQKSGPYSILVGELGKIPFVMRIYNEINPEDVNNYIRFLHRISIGTSGGILTLNESNGSVIWNSEMYIPDGITMNGNSTETFPEHMFEQSETILFENNAKYSEIFLKKWPEAIYYDLKCIADEILGRKKDVTRAQKVLTASAIWHDMTEHMGHALLNSNMKHAFIKTLDIIRESPILAEYRKSRRKQKNTTKTFEECAILADEELRNLDRAYVDEYMKTVNSGVCLSMIYTLNKVGVFTENKGYTFDDIIVALHATKENEFWMLRWIEVLEKNGYITKKNGQYMCDYIVTKDEYEQIWTKIRRLWSGKMGSYLSIDYIMNNIENLSGLIDGSVKATYLLFPQGNMSYANALYKDRITARYFNKLAAEIIKTIIVQSQKKDISLLELGAGTGATSDIVLRELRDFYEDIAISYAYTDISNFFITEAKKRYENCNHLHMSYGVINADLDFASQGLTEKKDIIMAVGMLNNVDNIDKSVQEMFRWLHDDGTIIVIEPIREFVELLVSQVFMMKPPSDDRKNSRTTFMSVKQWKDVFIKAGAEEIVVLPDENHILSPFGEVMFVVKKKK